MTARERLLDLVAREVETAAQEGHPTGVKYLPATLDEVRELLDAVEAEARRPLEEALETAHSLLEAFGTGLVKPPVGLHQGCTSEDCYIRVALAQREPAS